MFVIHMWGEGRNIVLEIPNAGAMWQAKEHVLAYPPHGGVGQIASYNPESLTGAKLYEVEDWLTIDVKSWLAQIKLREEREEHERQELERKERAELLRLMKKYGVVEA